MPLQPPRHCDQPVLQQRQFKADLAAETYATSGNRSWRTSTAVGKAALDAAFLIIQG